jgi:hypothetical protein
MSLRKAVRFRQTYKSEREDFLYHEPIKEGVNERTSYIMYILYNIPWFFVSDYFPHRVETMT